MASISVAGGTEPDGETITTNKAGEFVAKPDLDLINDVAEARYEASAGQANMDDVFYDIFVDKSKISSTNNFDVVTGSNSYITTVTDARDGFEDNDISEYTGDKSEYSVQSTTVDTGSYALKCDNPDGNSYKLTNSFSTEKKPNTLTATLRVDSGSKFQIYWLDSSGTIMGRVQLHNSGDVKIMGNQHNSWSTGTWYTLTLKDIDYSNNEVGRVLVDGVQKDSNVSFFNNVSGVQELVIKSNKGGNKYVDVVSTSRVQDTGDVTSTTKNLDFTPTKILVNQDLSSSTSNNDDIQYVVSDNSGNSKTVDQSEINQYVSVPFSDGDITVKTEFNNGFNGKINEYGVMFV